MVNTLASFPDPLAVLATVILTVLLAAIGWIDARTLRIPDMLSLPLVGLGFGWSALRPDLWVPGHLIGAVAGYSALALIGEVYFRRRGIEGLGLGDAKLFAAAGAWLGWQALPQVLLIAALSGLVFAMVRRASGGPKAAQMAFGPWLALGFWLVWMGQRAQDFS